MIPQWIIEKKRDGEALSPEEVQAFLSEYIQNKIPEYQMAALLMAVYFQGMTLDEVLAFTDVMLHSGDILNLSSIPQPKADKHSTGGIGDKISLALAPLVASCGVVVPMISGRGLGITGGTLDKLESIHGYRTDLSVKEMTAVLQACGCSITGQTEQLAPADRRIYALRDVTATVPSVPLISASIMSKKLAEGIDALVLDVKYGRGAFMKTAESARTLASTMMRIGEKNGTRMAALLTDMNQPLGRSVGNALEVQEVVATLQGNGPDDTLKLVMELARAMCILANPSGDRAGIPDLLKKHIDSGAAFERFQRMVDLHKGDPKVLEDPSRLPAAAMQFDFLSPESGYITEVDADGIGRASLVLGGGRKTVEDRIDPAVGLSGIVKRGEKVSKGDPLLRIHANDESRLSEAKAWLDNAFAFSDEPPADRPLIAEVMGVE